MSQDAPPFDLATTDRLLSTTRAVRRRLDLERPVERQVILDCVALSQQAPTASNTQNWRWVVVTDAEKRAAISDIYRRGAGAIANAKAAAPETDHQTRRVYDSAEYLLEHLHRVPVLVIPCLIGRVPAGAPHGLMAASYGSIFGAMWSFQLALRSRGLGTVLTTLHLFHEEAVADVLGIPSDVVQCALLPVAYTIGTDFKPARRPAPEEVTYWDGWQPN
jgi:nitroreductase